MTINNPEMPNSPSEDKDTKQEGTPASHEAPKEPEISGEQLADVGRSAEVLIQRESTSIVPEATANITASVTDIGASPEVAQVTAGELGLNDTLAGIQAEAGQLPGKMQSEISAVIGNETPIESERERRDREDAELLALFMSDHPEVFAKPETKRECGPEVAELEKLFTAFEAEHSLDALHAIVDLTPEEAPNHPVREPAKNALAPITQLFNTIKDKTNITPDALAILTAKRKRLSQAVGIINKGKVDHTR